VRQLHVIVRGRVQGVGFRWFVREEARRRDLAGWVQNRPDGGVEVAAAGPDAALDAFEAQLRIGPSGAQVTQLESIVDSTNESSVALAKPFAILR
jgi:acylphosphatase